MKHITIHDNDPTPVDAPDTMTTVLLDSSTALPGTVAPSLPLLSADHRGPLRGSDGVRQSIPTSFGDVWVEGNCIICACPDCGAPINVRLWLMKGSCWQCETCIELTHEQQEELQRLLDAAAESERIDDASHPRNPASSDSPASPTPIAPDRRSMTSLRGQPRRHDPNHLSQPAGGPHFYQRRTPTRDRLAPAWLVSLILHLIAILLLALITLSATNLEEEITLSTFVATDDTLGGEIRVVDLNDDVEFDLPSPIDADLSNAQAREALVRAEQEARELRIDPTPLVPPVDVEIVKRKITDRVGPRMSFAARDPQVRVEMVHEEGGTSLTEAAVARGLRWLAKQQNSDGSWSLHDYDKSYRESNRGDAAGTSLALLPFLGAGQTHERGIYKGTVAKGLRWLIERQKPNGDLRAGLKDQRGMYAHGQGAIVLVEAFSMSGDEQFREPAQKAIDFIVAAQHELGGWRYQPGESGDTSVFGWQMMALQSAKTPGLGLVVPDSVFKLASYYLDSASMADGALYRYRPIARTPATPTMTAEALLCRMYLGWTRDDPRLSAGLEWLETEHPPGIEKPNIYYWYYATQSLHHFGGKTWERWNLKMRELLVEMQQRKGSQAGSWDPRGFAYGTAGGRIYVTSLAVCTLEVYYRHLPLFKQIDLGP